MQRHPKILIAGQLAALASLVSCAGPASKPPRPTIHLEDCPRLAIFATEADLLRGLPTLYSKHFRDLIVIETSVYLNRCSSVHLGGASEGSRLGDAGEESRTGDAGEGSRSGGAVEKSRVGARSEKSRSGDAGEKSRIAGRGEAGRSGGAGEASRLANAGEKSRTGDAGEESKLGHLGEASRLGGVSEGSRVAGASSSCRCHRSADPRGYTLVGIPRGRRVRVFDGVELRQLAVHKLGD